MNIERPAPEARLRAASLRVTAPRLAVLAAVESDPHADVETIAAAVRGRIGSVSTQAVYDVLRVLTGANLIRRIEPAGSPALFETRVGDNHHHVVCRSCGIVGDIDCAIGTAPCLESAASNGFAIDEAEITYWGLCPDCQHSATSVPRPAGATAPAPH
jgi:Fe2+ or Zn2+ uptake regulation protein